MNQLLVRHFKYQQRDDIVIGTKVGNRLTKMAVQHGIE